MIARNYQQDAAAAIFAAWDGGDRATLVVMPTGTGKTILFADVIRQAKTRALIIAHREELIHQAADKVRRVTGLAAGIEMADLRVDAAHNGEDLFGGLPPVVVSSVQTQTAGGDGGGRMAKFRPDDFGLLIIDEAHHATASTYRRIIDYYTQNPALRVLGVTATPDRGDEAALGQVFNSVAYDYEIADAIADGWLVPIEQQTVTVEGLDLSHVRTTAGDLNGADLAAVMVEEKPLHGIAGPSLEIIADRRALVFASSVAHAERLAEIYNRHRPAAAAWLCGKTPKDDRSRLLEQFRAGDTQIVVNVGVLTEGFDDPGVRVVVMARPTKSRALYAQMIGRATRPLPGVVDQHAEADARRAAIAASGKPACLVVDFAGNAGRHALVSTADILGGKYNEAVVARAAAKTKDRGPVDMTRALEEAAQEEADEKRRKDEAARRARLVARAKYSTAQVDPFALLGVRPWAPRGWDAGKTLSEKQRALLERQGVNPDAYSYTQAKQLIGEIVGRMNDGKASLKQAKILARFGYPTDCTRAEASKTIDAIAAAGWRRPATTRPPCPSTATGGTAA